MLMLLAALASQALGQTFTLVIIPAGPITYGTPEGFEASVYGDNNCGGKTVSISPPGGALTATAVQTSFLPAPPMCVAFFPPSIMPVDPNGFIVDVIAEYDPGGFSISSPAFVFVNQAVPNVVIASTPNPSLAGQAVLLTATASAASAMVARPDGNGHILY